MDLTMFNSVGIVIGVLTGTLSIWKFFDDAFGGRRAKLREEYTFAKEFLKDAAEKDGLHNFAKTKGLKAIANRSNVDTNAIDYLLTFKESENAILNFVIGQMYLKCTKHGQKEAIEYRGFARFAFVRWLILVVCPIIYFSFYYGLFHVSSDSYIAKHPGFSLSSLVVYMVMHGVVAWFAMTLFSKLLRARKVMILQEVQQKVINTDNLPNPSEVKKLLAAAPSTDKKRVVESETA